MSDKYYQAEFRYLVEAGKAFAKRFPELARELNLTDVSSRDPNVERLMEGFAFLSSRTRKRLDDDFPQLVEGLMAQIWPHHGRPVPSFCLLEFQPRQGQLDQALEVPRGAEVETPPLEQGLRCRYRTTAPLWITPFSLSELKGESLGTVCRMQFKLSAQPEADTAHLCDRPLSFQFYGEYSNCCHLYNLILGLSGEKRHLHKVHLTARGAQGEMSWDLPPDHLRPKGLERSESLRPNPDNAFWGFSLLQDYFLYKEKYQGFNLELPPGLASLGSVAELDFRLEINHPWPSELLLNQNHLRLNCIPAVNLFSHDAEPIRVDHLHDAYRVVADLRNLDMFEVFSVDRVEGINLQNGKRREFQPLFAARSHLGQNQAHSIDGPFFETRRRSSVEGRRDVYLSIADPGQKGGFPQDETLSLDLTVSNGRHGSKPMAGQISQGVSQIPDTVRFKNLNQPSQAFTPQSEADSLWIWLGYASLNYLDLDSAPRMQSLLLRMLSRSNEADLRRIQGIGEVRQTRVRERYKASLLSGNHVGLTVKEDHFSSLGDLQLFGQVLARFLGAYVSLNSFNRLMLTCTPSGHNMFFERQLGELGGLSRGDH